MDTEQVGLVQMFLEQLTLVEQLTIFAIFAGPIVAVTISLAMSAAYQLAAQKRNARMWVLGQVISYRHDVMHLESVRALNQIDFAYSRRKDIKVRQCWKNFIEGMRNDGVKSTERLERYNELVTEMCKAMGYGKAFGYIDVNRVLVPPGPPPPPTLDPATQEIQAELLRVLKSTGNLTLEPREREDEKVADAATEQHKGKDT